MQRISRWQALPARSNLIPGSCLLTLALHTPPYTDGGHDSDSDYDSGGRMKKVRENLVPIFDEYGVQISNDELLIGSEVDVFGLALPNLETVKNVQAAFIIYSYGSVQVQAQ